MKLIASIMLAESSVDDYLQGLLETAYKTIAGRKGPAHVEFWSLSEEKQKNKLFVAMKRLDQQQRDLIDYGVEVIEDMLEDFLASAHPDDLHEDEAVQAVGKKLAAGKSSSKAAESEVSEPVEPKEEVPAEETEGPETEQPDEGTVEPTVDQRVIITKGVHKGEVHQFVGKTGSGLYKLKIVDIDADKIKYNGVGAAVKREDFKLVEGLLTSFVKSSINKSRRKTLDRQPLTDADRDFIVSVFSTGHNAFEKMRGVGKHIQGDYVLPENVMVNYKKGKINFYKDGTLIRASVGFYEDESGPGNPRQSPMTSEDFEVRTKADLEKIKKAISY